MTRFIRFAPVLWMLFCASSGGADSAVPRAAKINPVVSLGCIGDCVFATDYDDPFPFTGHVKPVNGVAFSALATLVVDGIVVDTWDPNVRQEIRSPIRFETAAGRKSVAVHYPGDINYEPGGVTFVFTINKAPSQIALVSAGADAQAKLIFLRGTVAGGGLRKPTGRVNLYDGGTLVANALLDSSGVAAFAIPNAANARRDFQAAYVGDENYLSGQSAVVSVHPVQAETACTLTGPAVGRETDAIAVSAAVTAKTPVQGAAAPSGFMEIRSGATVLATLQAGTTANVQLGTRPRGIESLTLAYAGDGSYKGCASAPLVMRIDGALAPFSAASALAKLAPGSIGSVYGTGFASAVTAAPALPLPTTLGGLTLELRSGAATMALPLFFTSPGQVNFQLPLTAPVGAAELVLRNASSFWRAPVDIQAVAPALFSASGDGQGAAAALYLKRTPGVPDQTGYTFTCAAAACTSTPLDVGAEGDTLVVMLFGTGLRNAGGNRSVAALIGTTLVQVIYAGPQAETPGLDQVNLIVPRSLAGRGVLEVRVAVDGVASNAVQIAVR